MKSSKAIFKLGVILMIVQIISLILACVVSGFSAMSLISFVLPILYLIGAKQCID